MLEFSNNRRNSRKKSTDDLSDSSVTNIDRLAQISVITKNLLKKLHKPADATNRFVNLALQDTDENSQGRQFLLESKASLRRLFALLKRLNSYADKIESEIDDILRRDKE
jgi:hypothetical protein